MTGSPVLGSPLDAVLDAWDRHHRALIALLRLLPEGGLDARGLG
jgi:hypothetical protein